jgi:hypothetical protein
LAQWHIEQGFPDPTKTPLVKKVLKGIRELHPMVGKQARPLQLEQLEQLDAWLTACIASAAAQGNQRYLIYHSRNRALILLGFWRGLRSDELCRLHIEHPTLSADEGMTFYLPRSKGDRQNQGRAPTKRRHCYVCAQ